MSDDPFRRDCPSCGLPGQLAGLNCGFCHARIPDVKGVKADTGYTGTERPIGWKGMRVQRQPDGQLLLIPPMYAQDGPWTPGEWQVATCGGRPFTGPESHHVDNPDPALVVPVKTCMCGYYSGRTREHQISLGYMRYTESDPRVLVELELAGKIFPASNGWRAQKVKPRTIHVPHELWQVGRDLKAAYGPAGVEVKMGVTLILPKDAVPERCPKCTVPWDSRATVCGFCQYRLNGG